MSKSSKAWSTRSQSDFEGLYLLKAARPVITTSLTKMEIQFYETVVKPSNAARSFPLKSDSGFPE